MTRKQLILIPLILFSFFGFSQDAKKAKMWTKYGDESFAERDYYGASKYYKHALRIDSTNIRLKYKYGTSLRKYNEYELAEKVFQEIYDEDEAKTIPNALFWLASMQKYNGKYKEARRNFKAFPKLTKDKSGFEAKKAKQEVKSCSFAQKLILDTANVIFNNLGAELNSTSSEFSATRIDSNHIYFSSLRTKKENPNNVIEDDEYIIRLYKGKKEGGVWKDDGEVEKPINNGQNHTANGSYNEDCSEFYFTRCDENFRCDIYMSRWTGNKWGIPQALPIEINDPLATNTQPVWAKIGKYPTLIFVSNRQKSKGGMDIWYSEYKKDKWNRAKNVGSKVNSKGDDVTPYWEPKEKKLYFSSGWWYGLGGFDVHEVGSASGTLKGLSRAENIGLPFNSSVNDLYFSYDKPNANGFVTSNRKGSITRKGETCCNDLYYYEYPDTTPPPIYVSLEELNKYLPVTLYFHNDCPNPRTRDSTTNLNYMTTFKDYIDLVPEYQEEYSSGLFDEQKEKAKLDIQIFFEDYVEKGVEDLELFTELLLKELEKGQEIEMTVKGFASPLAKTDYNVPLTLRRISSMENFMMAYEEGIYKPYFDATAENGGTLELVRIPFGEYRADQLISDNPNDVKNSVYSRKAAMERKIQIISVHQAHKDSSYAQLKFNNAIRDFGSVTAGDSLMHTFTFSNSGNDTLQIDSVSADCGCTTADWPKEKIAPGGTGEVHVVFDTNNKEGILSKHVTLFTNGIPKERELTLTAEVH